MATKKITKQNIFDELSIIFNEIKIIGDYEDRTKKIEERFVSLPIQQNLYSKSSLIVHLGRIGYNNSPNLHGYVQDFLDQKQFKSVEIEIPNWAMAYEYRAGNIPKATFFYFDSLEQEVVDDIVEEYIIIANELGEKNVQIILNTQASACKPKK